jgi:hypothetical protein
MLRTMVQLGTLAIEIQAPTLRELLEEVSYLQELDQAREGAQDAVPFFRDFDGYTYYGFRRPDGAEVYWGQHKQASDARKLFAYAPTSEGYRGWQRYDAERKERVPADGAPASDRSEAPALTPSHVAALQYINDHLRAVPKDRTVTLRLPRGKRSAVVLRRYVPEAWELIRGDAEMAEIVADAIATTTGVRRG